VRLCVQYLGYLPQGATEKEALENIQDAILTYLEMEEA